MMATPAENYVLEKTRRIVARDALRRASAMVQDWQSEEQANTRLAKRLVATLLITSLFATLLFIYL